jgi:mono/diheme cytochrome c family protein
MKFKSILQRARAGIAVVVIGAMVAACTPSAPPESPADRFAKDPAAVKRGKGIFLGTCAAYCHSLKKDNRDAPYLFDCEWLHGGSDAEIHNTIVNGVPGTRMVGFGNGFPQGDDDTWRVVAFLKTNREACPTP